LCAQLAIGRKEIDERVPCTKLHKSVIILPPLDAAAKHVAVEREHSFEIDNPENQVVDVANANGIVVLAHCDDGGWTLTIARTAGFREGEKEFSAAVAYQFARANRGKDDALDWAEAKKAGVRSKQVFDAADSDHDGTLDLTSI
jgi:hypothetical protein